MERPIPKEDIEREIKLTSIILENNQILFNYMADKLDYEDLQKLEELITKLSLDMMSFMLKVRK